MEINQVSNANFTNINYENLQKIDNPNGIVDSVNSIVKNDSVIKNIDSSTSEFNTNLTSSISNISGIQSLQSVINKQINIVKEIDLNIKNSVTIKSLDTIQPKVQDLLENFNTNAKSIVNLNQIVLDQDSENSTAYFDGILGSKPLSPSDILTATQNKMRLLESMKSTTQDKYVVAIDDIKSVITKETQSTQEKSPFKEINFGKESSDFNSNTINNTVGAIATTQAHASQAHSIRLLSQ